MTCLSFEQGNLTRKRISIVYPTLSQPLATSGQLTEYKIQIPLKVNTITAKIIMPPPETPFRQWARPKGHSSV